MISCIVVADWLNERAEKRKSELRIIAPVIKYFMVKSFFIYDKLAVLYYMFNGVKMFQVI